MANLFDKVSRNGYDTVQKIKNVTEAGKAKTYIAEEENKIAQYYQMVGKFYFEEFSKMNTTPAEPYSTWFSEINKGLSNIKKFEEEILSLRGMLCCPECGNAVKLDAVFCGFCGANLSEAKKNITTVRYCPSCGEEVSEGASFCASCGHKL